MAAVHKIIKSFLIILSLATAMATSAQNKLFITVGDRTLSATMADNEAARRLVQLLSVEPITINLSDYGGFEKVGALPQSLPASDT